MEYVLNQVVQVDIKTFILDSKRITLLMSFVYRKTNEKEPDNSQNKHK
ncbi:hypothetical protein LEP1GSC041_4595 [Leptospira noguchii str. 2006001870]|nr:hypothetical protein LEP1GSC041_4595 [Leptospira noguchii str. 2006001870]